MYRKSKASRTKRVYIVNFVRENGKHFVVEVIFRLEEDEYKVNYLKRTLEKREDIFKFSMPENPNVVMLSLKTLFLVTKTHDTW